MLRISVEREGILSDPVRVTWEFERGASDEALLEALRTIVQYGSELMVTQEPVSMGGVGVWFGNPVDVAEEIQGLLERAEARDIAGVEPD